MEALIILAAIVTGLIGFGAAALRWGVDSRELYLDPRGRRAR